MAFFEDEVARSKKGISLSQQKYILDMLSKVGMFRCKDVDTQMDSNLKSLPD